jgi:HK97 family phage prohead protease
MKKMERDLEQTLVQRDFKLEVREVEKEDRTLEFPFSSEQAVARYFGNEVLEHREKSADLTRLNDGAPVLWNHDPSAGVIGVVERAWIDEKKKRGYAQVRFSEEEFASSIYRDIKNGIIRNISFGYVIKEMEQRGDDQVATNWEAYEVSVVAIPADNSIGINRAAATTQESDNILSERINDSASSDAPLLRKKTWRCVQRQLTPKR